MEGAPLTRTHEPQRGLGGHTPQRNEQSERRRYQHNRQLELGCVIHPLHNAPVCTATFITGGWTILVKNTS